MKRKSLHIVLIVVLAFTLILSGCNKGTTSNGKDDPKEETEESDKEESDDKEVSGEGNGTIDAADENGDNKEDDGNIQLDEEEKARADKRKEEYVKILRNLHEKKIAPDGEDLGATAGEFDDFEENTFAVVDIDSDGEEELIFDYTGTYMAAQFETIYYYNTYSNELVTKMAFSPYNEYFTNGLIKCNASHNHSYSMNLWPYTLKQYSSGAGEYVNVGSVNAWDKELYPMDYNNEPFPDDIDEDGDGVVYFIYEGQDGDEVEPQIVDGDAYNSWLSGNMMDALPMKVKKFKLTKYNIDQYEKMDGYVLDVDDVNYTEFVYEDMIYYLPKEFVEKVEIIDNNDGVTFIHKATEEMGKKVYGADAMGWIGQLKKFDDWSYFDLPHYRFLGSSDTASYVMILPSDVQAVLPSEYAKAKEHGNEVTEDELTKVMEEYQLVCEIAKDIHPIFVMG